jgi:hypothetical protein
MSSSCYFRFCFLVLTLTGIGIFQVAGDQDPYTSLRLQQELFCNLGRGSDRSWSILADADHAVHLLDGRTRFLQVVASFLRNAKRSEQTHH